MIAVFLAAMVLTSLAGCSAGYGELIRAGDNENAWAGGAETSEGTVSQDNKRTALMNLVILV